MEAYKNLTLLLYCDIIEITLGLDCDRQFGCFIL